MNPEKLQEAIDYYNDNSICQHDWLKPIIDLAQLHLLAGKGMVERKECIVIKNIPPNRDIQPLTCHKCFECGFNSALDACIAFWAGRVEGIKGIVMSMLLKSCILGEEVYFESREYTILEKLSNIIAQAIKTELLGG